APGDRARQIDPGSGGSYSRNGPIREPGPPRSQEVPDDSRSPL
ncbi:MAG: hypothetical protein AVDCRST_MAG43-1917, partial [uncultured Thermomicrobiales bacterium]